jgi:hypothetical protein
MQGNAYYHLRGTQHSGDLLIVIPLVIAQDKHLTRRLAQAANRLAHQGLQLAIGVFGFGAAKPARQLVGINVIQAD